MPEPEAHPDLPRIQRVARRTLVAGLGLMLLKFGIFAVTDSVAVLTDALESIINVVAAAVMVYSVWLANRPADREHPYGHGKIEFLAVGFEGAMILVAGLIIAIEAVRRLIQQTEPANLGLGAILLSVVALLAAALAVYVWRSGKQTGNDVLVADGKHLAADAVSTLGVIGGLLLVRWTGKAWVDPLVAFVIAAIILFTSWRLLWQSIGGLMDRSDPADDRLIRRILDQEVAEGAIDGYHKVRHRHTGAFHWVDMHLHVPPEMSVRHSHELASRIEKRIEDALGQGNATAHVEPTHAGDKIAQSEANPPPQR